MIRHKNFNRETKRCAVSSVEIMATIARECLRLSQRHSEVRNFPKIKKVDDYKSDELVQIFIGSTIKIAELIISNVYFYLLLYEVKFPL